MNELVAFPDKSCKPLCCEKWTNGYVLVLITNGCISQLFIDDSGHKMTSKQRDFSLIPKPYTGIINGLVCCDKYLNNNKTDDISLQTFLVTTIKDQLVLFKQRNRIKSRKITRSTTRSLQIWTNSSGRYILSIMSCNHQLLLLDVATFEVRLDMWHKPLK